MTAEFKKPILFHHHGATGGTAKEGQYILVKEDDKYSRGIHFHSTESLTPKEATEFLRISKFTEKHENVLSVIYCGKDRRGFHGYAARTDAMSEPEELILLRRISQRLLNMLHLH